LPPPPEYATDEWDVKHMLTHLLYCSFLFINL